MKKNEKREKKKILKDTPHDGHCLFHAVTRQFAKITKSNRKSIGYYRSQIINDKTVMKSWKEDGRLDPDEIRSIKMAARYGLHRLPGGTNSNGWGGITEALILATINKIKIRIYEQEIIEDNEGNIIAEFYHIRQELDTTGAISEEYAQICKTGNHYQEIQERETTGQDRNRNKKEDEKPKEQNKNKEEKQKGEKEKQKKQKDKKEKQKEEKKEQTEKKETKKKEKGEEKNKYKEQKEKKEKNQEKGKNAERWTTKELQTIVENIIKTQKKK